MLFVQLMPRIVHADMAEEVRKITHVETGDVAKFKGRLLEFDDFGFTPFAVAAVLGILLGSVKLFNFFSLTTTGGTLLISLVFGHFGHVGRADLMPSKKVLETFRELGLMVFLIGTGGMTSTPALGTLIHVAGTSNVASAYAATYPIALIAVVLVTQLLVRVF